MCIRNKLVKNKSDFQNISMLGNLKSKMHIERKKMSHKNKQIRKKVSSKNKSKKTLMKKGMGNFLISLYRRIIC